MSSRDARSGSSRRSAISAEKDLVGLGEHLPDSPVGRQPAQAVDGHSDRPRRACGGEDSDQGATQELPPVVVLDPEHRPQNHLERDRLHAVGWRGKLRPTGHDATSRSVASAITAS